MRLTLDWLIFCVIAAAIDLAALRAALSVAPGPEAFGPRLPNPGLAITTLALQGGFYLAVTRAGAARWFWAGFEALGWAFVLATFGWALPDWRLTDAMCGRYMVGVSTARFIASAGAAHLLLCLAVASAGGSLGLAARGCWLSAGGVPRATRWRHWSYAWSCGLVAYAYLHLEMSIGARAASGMAGLLRDGVWPFLVAITAGCFALSAFGPSLAPASSPEQ